VHLLISVLVARIWSHIPLIDQLLHDKVMWKTEKSIWWNPKVLSAHGTRCFASQSLVVKMALKTFEAECMETW